MASELLCVTEGVESTWHYHVSHVDSRTVALCGATVMRTEIPLSAWGVRTEHLRERYCARCAWAAGLSGPEEAKDNTR
jgi:hypothetical protein